MSGGAVGTVRELWRYPVKSFGGERLAACRMEPCGPAGDRSHAFIDRRKTGFARYVTAREIPAMLGYSASLAEEAAAGEFGRLTVHCPNGETAAWDERLLQQIRSLYGEDGEFVDMHRHPPDSAAVCDEENKVGGLYSDGASVLLVADSSLRELERLWGKPLDPQRFRANVVVALQEEASRAEPAWVGRRLAVGEAELAVYEACTRCRLITLDPATPGADPDAGLLRELVRRQDGVLGVYATVARPGLVREGDALRLADAYF